MLSSKSILATRKFPAPVEDRLSRDYQTILNPEDRLYGTEALLVAARGMDALFACATERFDAGAIGRLDKSVKIIGMLSVGTDHLDLAAAKGIEVVVRHIRPEELSGFTECFVTGTAAEVTPVGQIGEYGFTPGALSLGLMEDYGRLVRRQG